MTTDTEPRTTPYVIEWREGFGIGIPLVDQEHRHLFALVKSLNVDTVERTVDELLEYVVTHFTNEQALMERSRYPAFEQHLRLHEEFGASVADFLANGESWDEERVQKLRRFLNKWLIGHIMTHDLRFGRWYAEHRAHVAAVARTAPAPAAPVAASRPRGWFARLFGRG